MTTRIALHGFGRLARCIARLILTQPELGIEIVAIAERAPPGKLAHLLRHDSAYGPFGSQVVEDEHGLVVDGRPIPILDLVWGGMPENHWGAMGIDVLIETTGKLRSPDTLAQHLDRGARRVLLAAPPRGLDEVPTLFLEPGLELPDAPMVSTGSATATALHPLATLLDQCWGLEALHGTVLSPFAPDQVIEDEVHSTCFWRSRAGVGNMVPTTAGAGRGLLTAFPKLRERLMLQNLRTPVSEVGCLSLVAHTHQAIQRDAFIEAAQEAAAGRLRGLLAVCKEPLVSCDFRGRPESVVLDTMSIQTSGPKAISFRAWYDATWGYASRVVELAQLLGEARRS